jgi:hypothetical protein
MSDKPKLSQEAFYAQFPNVDHHDHDPGYTRPEWHELYNDVPEKHGFAKGGAVSWRKKKRGQSDMVSKALGIVGRADANVPMVARQHRGQ